jgi:Domain of unknown function (DUF4331)
MHAVPVDVECARLRHRQQGGGKDALAGYNVHTVALQIPKSKVRGKGEVVGARRARENERSRRERRARLPLGSGLPPGEPLLNELLIPTADKDYWNSEPPHRDKLFNRYLADRPLRR